MRIDRTAPVIPVVDSADRFSRWATRQDVHDNQLVHRSVNALVFDAQDRLLLQLRHRDKSTQPSHWDLSCSGHVERIDHRSPFEGRAASDLSIRRELLEELGVVTEPIHVHAVPPIPDIAYEYMQLYVLRYDGPFQLQSDEVEAVRWSTLDSILKWSPITRQLKWFATQKVLLNTALSILKQTERTKT